MNYKNEPPVFTAEEIQRITLAALKGSPNKSATTEQLLWFVNECIKMRVEGLLADLIASGKVSVAITGDSPDTFKVGTITALV